MKKAEEVFIAIAWIIIMGLVACFIFDFSDHDSRKSRRLAEARVEQEAIEKELWEKQKAYEDSVRLVRQKEDSLKLVSLSKQYGQTFKSIQAAFGSASYTTETIETWCQMTKTYGVQCVLDEIRGKAGLKCDVTNLELRSKYQKRCGRERANKIISACRSNFGLTDWNDVETISRRQVRIGFNEEQCRLAWGRPYDINRSTYSWGTHEQWCYSGYNYLYFEDGVLTSIQN